MTSPAVSLQSVIELNDSPVLVIDSTHRVVAVNRSYCASFGVCSGELVGCDCRTLADLPGMHCRNIRNQCPYDSVFGARRGCEITHTNPGRNGTPHPVRIKADPLVDAAGGLLLIETIQALGGSIEGAGTSRMVGSSPAFLEFSAHLEVAARSEAPILIQGESGTGKELAARFVHEHSSRRDRPYVEINCASLPEHLCESELFGHERGSFTGSTSAKRGLIESAEGGTLFLDEIGEMPLPLQAKLLRVLDTGHYRRVGGLKSQNADVRLVSATNRNLLEMVVQGKFREDLYFRIAGIRVVAPPLRERKADIPVIAKSLLARICGPERLPCRLHPVAIERLTTHDWPGNIRELRNVLMRAVALSENGAIGPVHIRFDDPFPRADRAEISWAAQPRHLAPEGTFRGETIGEIEMRYIRELLMQHGGNRRKVAQILGMSERTLYRRLHAMRIEPTINH